MAFRVLHVWNTAGVASVIGKFSDRLFGARSRVMTRKAADRVGLTSYGQAYDDGPALFFARALLASRDADVVHVHSLDRIVPWLKTLYQGEPVIMHYHGTDILGRWGEKQGRWKRADRVAYSTVNLADGAPENAALMPNPVDTDLFYPRGPGPTPGSALSIRYGMDAETERTAREMSLNLNWVERGSVPHANMPGLLSRFEYFLDFRRPSGFPGPVQSVGRAALEALACGSKVVDWSGRILTGLPQENRPEAVAKKWHEVYQQLAEAKGSPG